MTMKARDEDAFRLLVEQCVHAPDAVGNSAVMWADEEIKRLRQLIQELSADNIVLQCQVQAEQEVRSQVIKGLVHQQERY